MDAELPGWVIMAAGALTAAIGALFLALSKAWADRVADSQKASDRTMELATAGQSALTTLATAIEQMRKSMDQMEAEQRRTTDALKSCTKRQEG